MKTQELKNLYLNFFSEHNHQIINGKSLIPENDPTVLFTTAGMHPLVPYILSEPHPAGDRLVNYQRCIRTGDIDAVGDSSHLTFFEMLGNWSLGDYFKKEALALSYEFLTASRWLGLPADKLSVTVFAGDQNIPADEESAAIWQSLGIPASKVYFLPKKDNWWGPAGATGPCGPDSEMFYDTGKKICSPNCRPGCSCGKYLEIWNDVFMQYNKTAEGHYKPLRRKCVDTGMGVERTAAVLQGKSSVFKTESFEAIIESIENISNTAYPDDDSNISKSIRVIADHIKAAVFIIGDDLGVLPSNLGQGYILRRLLRRACRHGRSLGVNREFLTEPAKKVIDFYGSEYQELAKRKDSILKEILTEESRFLATLEKGEHEFIKLAPNLLKNPKKIIPGRIAFKLYDTYGFPLEITKELAEEHGLTVDEEGFRQAFKKHQSLSKKGAEKTFKGGLADHSTMTTALHTATHLLHQALRQVLGEHVRQKGSNITTERLRFDFTHSDKLSDEELRQVEIIVNRQIKACLPIKFEVTTLREAKDRGALAFFTNKYEDQVKVYSIGSFSTEVCGGPHVENTSALGGFKILKEQSSSSGVRRIRAIVYPNNH